MKLWTDLTEAVVEHLQMLNLGMAQNLVLRIGLEGYQEVTALGWQYYMASEVYRTPKAQSFTADYSAATRTLTATVAWPSWLNGQVVRMRNQTWRVAQVSNTQAVLANPAPDADGTAESVKAQFAYLRPANDILHVKQVRHGNVTLMPVRPERGKTVESFMSAQPAYYSLMADDIKRPGKMAIRLWPPAEVETDVTVLYERRAASLVFTGFATEENGGTITTVAGSATVTGTGTAWRAEMAGAGLRVARTGTMPPGSIGSDRYSEEYVIASVESPTSLTLTEPATVSRTGVGYRIASVLDIPDYLWPMVVAAARLRLSLMVGKGHEQAMAIYASERTKAREQDSAMAYEGNLMSAQRYGYVQAIIGPTVE